MHLSEWSSYKRRCGWKSKRGKAHGAWSNLLPGLRCSPIRYPHLGCSLFNPFFMETKLMTNGALFNLARLLLTI